MGESAGDRPPRPLAACSHGDHGGHSGHGDYEGHGDHGDHGGPPPPGPRAAHASEPDGELGLARATALVAGNIVGTGIFLLPAALAVFGTVGIAAFGIVTVGAIALAVVFGRLGARLPSAGGPYVYARDAFGEFPGFLNAWSFWITAWAGNAGIAFAWVGYVNYFLHWDSTAGKIAIGLAGLCIPALINLSGVRTMGTFQLVTAALKFAPLIFISVVGLAFVRADNFGPFNATAGTWAAALSGAAALVLFAYSGVESAAVAAEKVKDPIRNIGRASVYGCLACAALYMLSTVAIFGTVPQHRLVHSEAPFADAVNGMFGGGFWGGVVAACAIVSGLGALNGWTMLVAEMPLASARDGLFPSFFTRVNARDVPYVGVIAGAVLASATFVTAFAAENAFSTILLLATFTTVIPYMFSAAAQMFWLVTGGRRVEGRHLARDVAVAAVALLFTFWMVVGAGSAAVFQGTLMLLMGIPIYIWIKASRGEYGVAR
ncbi:basic amino acid/polyamine antiporter, APA family [Sinosporangium album]|uniref:Basic amino acid/polyamine antiporter, APA family n=1 Tax=Sinosporangium album TaxID=504805 RepID=A0A1G7XGT2_9ACTN|nr:amino acid permease [Sinosporangium album]SDG83301.1 basic amino acid/polyamine antiporter, APA family [Sinosporangium album]